MIDPHAIPQFKGDLEQLEKDASALKKQAGKFRTTGADVHSKFQSLSGVYHAPEAQQLFDTTTPVRDMSDVIADDLEKIAAALSDYADEVRPIKSKLRRLKHRAAAFVEKVKDDEHWKDDEKKIAEHSGLLHDVNVAVAAFQAAERRAANKIGERFFGSTHYTVDDGSGKRGMYGYRAGDLDKVKDLPWGTPEKETHRVWELDYWGASAAKGFGIDGFGGDLDGLATLVGWHGGDKASQAWSALGDTFSGLGQYTTWPYDWAMSKTIGGGNGDNEQKKAFREALKGFVAWDEWDKDPVRAGGQVLYNLTPFGIASKLGKMAKGSRLAEVTKVTKVADSLTAGTRAARAALPKASEVLAAVKRLPHWGDAPHLDRTVDAADDLAHPRDAGVRLPDRDGRPPTVLDDHGNIRHAENGEIIHDIKDARKESNHPQHSLPEDHPAHERAREREKATVGSGADHQPPRAHAHTGDGPSAHHETSTGRHGGDPGADGHDRPSTGGHGDGSSGGHGDGPSGGHGDGHSTGGHHGPSADSPDAPAHDGAGGGDHDGPGTEGSSGDGPDGGSHAPSGGEGGSKGAPNDPGHTLPKRDPDPNAKAQGNPESISKKADPETRRALSRQNEAADRLAQHGYDVEHAPQVPGSRNPDYKINDKVFDCYSPSSGNARNIAREMEKKVEKLQTERVVLNLRDSSVDVSKMYAQLHDWPTPGLKEVIAIDKEGNVLHLFP
ncbi:hypothetical protein HUT19_29005 [Streptomyces sp. NA02950]|uniref:CdiA C-terminal domain-containing protein n=1 Tax=Streptomyces sp. NA02950 TaxID=2742137 RepID=UPI00158FD965|nr:hypothetical protein [Streptomyces sp. NA02950]QKV95272.1 hypothetical protein HUT19_29005 [Streptomyces sp. NA02950]